MIKIYFIAGEISGDFIGSCLMQSLKNEYSLQEIDLQFVGVGGKLMERMGIGTSLFSIKEINIMGLVEIIPHIYRITKLINLTVKNIIEQKPDILITIDSPAFTYRVAKKVRSYLPNLKMIHVVAPSVWAYKANRAKKYAKIYNCLFALLPFEPPYFKEVGLDCRYIGHPILEQKFYYDKISLRSELNIKLGTKIICVTPGSRKVEIIRHLPIFCEALNIVEKEYKNIEVIFVLADPSHEKLIKLFLSDSKFNYHFSNNKLKSFAVANVALAKSGTNTIEIAASNTPLVVAYKLNIITFLFIRLLIKIKFASLINIIPNREIIPELIQFKCTAQMIAINISKLLSNPKMSAQQLIDSQKILEELGFKSSKSPSILAAHIIKTEFL